MRHALSLTLAAVLIITFSMRSRAAALEMIDAHSQIPGGVSEAQVLAKMDEAGIAHVILSTVMHHDGRALLAFARNHRDRITVSIGLKSPKFVASAPEAISRVRRLGSVPLVGAMSELMILHQQKGNRAPQIIMAFDSPAAKAALDITAARGWPLVIHIEFGFADRNGLYGKYMKGLEALVAAHPGQPFALTHMAQLDSKAVARLIAAHPNLYFLTSHANPIFIAGHEATRRTTLPWTELFAGERLAADWRALFVAHPDRFVLAFDNVYDEDWHGDYYARQAALWRAALADLPPRVAEAVAHGNAERLWHLSARRPSLGSKPPTPRPAIAAATVGGRIVGPAGHTAPFVIAHHDRDGDGKLSRSEFHRPPAVFGRVDANHDGFITADELEAAWRRWHAGHLPGRRQPRIAKRGARGSPRRACTFAPVPASPDGPFKVDVYSPNCMFKGTTLFADVDDQKFSRIVEVDYAGRVVWSVTPSDFLDVPNRLQVMDVERLPSGNTLFNIKNYGAFEVTHDGKLVWQHYDDGISHDVDRLPNGNTIYVRGWVAKGEDLVREVDPGGKLVWSWNGLAQYDRPPFADNNDEGWMHANAVTRLANGNTMISLRNIDRTVVVNSAGNVVHEILYGRGIPAARRAEVKKRRGSAAVFRPHDPELEPDGDIVVASPGTNRAIEVTWNGALVRMIGKWPLKTDVRGLRDANRLPNGDTLLVGFFRIFEVSPEGQVVWSLHRKGVAPTGHALDSVDRSAGSNFYKAQRIAPDGTAYGH